MKLRIKGDTIRLRLSQEEVNTLVEKGEIWENCRFLNGVLKYGIIARVCDRMEAQFSGSTISIYMPDDWIQGWDKNQTVGFETDLKGMHYILVEKDFQCLMPREGEDESDLFPNPNAVKD